METTINGVHIQVIKRETMWAVYVNRNIIPVYMALEEDKWVFRNAEHHDGLNAIEAQVSEYLKRKHELEPVS